MLCGVLLRSNDDAEIGGVRARGQVDPVMSGRADASTVRGFCTGTGIPGAPVSYCSCALWVAEKDRIAAGRADLQDAQTARPSARVG